MNITLYTFLVIMGSGLVTWLPRIIPFLVVRNIRLPDRLLLFLAYVPVCILTALYVQSLLVQQAGQFPGLNRDYCLASLPTVMTAILTKNLLWVVIVGMFAMAAIRYFT